MQPANLDELVNLLEQRLAIKEDGKQAVRPQGNAELCLCAVEDGSDISITRMNLSKQLQSWRVQFTCSAPSPNKPAAPVFGHHYRSNFDGIMQTGMQSDMVSTDIVCANAVKTPY